MTFLSSGNVWLSTLHRVGLPKRCFLPSSRRFLHLHEYRSKSLLRRFGLNVQRGDVAETPEKAMQIASQLKSEGVEEFVVKCQVLAGGRGKGTLTSGLQGGVKLCKTPEEVQHLASQMLGYKIITHQTTSQGELVSRVLILESVNIVRELYLAFVLDASAGGPVIVASKKGGVDIEQVARQDPEAVVKIPLSKPNSVSRDECMKAAEALGLSEGVQSYPLNVADQIARLFNLFVRTDATLVEVNPLAVTKKCGDHLICIDAKLDLDDNAAYRQSELMAMEDKSQFDTRELEAQEHGLSFVSMEGKIGCLVNGAGLAMATMDLVKIHGGAPANFLDVGGSATVEQVTEAFKIIQADRNVRVIFVNIFGGIMRCDIIAEGLLKAAQATRLSMPLVVRLVGNNVTEGKRILEAGGIKCRVVDDLEEAAKTACKLAVTF